MPMSNKLPLSILNYYAAFTETKFNFKTLIAYRWTNNELTLDLSLFENFQALLLQHFKSGETTPISIRPSQYTLSISKEDIRIEIEKALADQFNLKRLETLITQELTKNLEKEKSFREGIRKYNQSIRKHLGKILIEFQDKKIDRLKAELGIENVPPSIFNSANYLSTHFNGLQLLAKDCDTSSGYHDKVFSYFKERLEDVVLYDLFINMQKYARLNTVGTQYIFFHELLKKGENGASEAYPIFFVETDITLSTQEVILSFPRDLILINTPAINYFRFPSVLTTSRSATFQNACLDLGGVEVFLQAQYGLSQPFILESNFKPIAPPDSIYPDIRCRIGVQTVQRENKKLLDYSEIMTLLSSGGKNKFSDFIKNYIDGNVESTQTQVGQEFNEKYPIKSPERYISDNPLNLNSSQKRILLALGNLKNKILVVDGPPGTGKSHTIAALIYWANHKKKSVVVTSHKKEALDVIDRMLTEKFRDLHPHGKPSIIRLDGKSGNSVNVIGNTLQNAVINAADNRVNDYNEPATRKDAETCSVNVISKLKTKLAASDNYQKTLSDLARFEMIQQELIQENILSETDIEMPRLNPSIHIDFDRVVEFSSRIPVKGLKDITLREFNFLLKHKNDIPAFIQACEEVNQHSGKLGDVVINTDEIPAAFTDLVEKCSKLFKPTVPVSQLTAKDIMLAASLKKLFNRTPSENEREKLIKSLKSLQYASIIEDIGRIQETLSQDLTLMEISSSIEPLRAAIMLKRHLDILHEYRAASGNTGKSIASIHETLSGVKDVLDLIHVDLINDLTKMFETYGPVLSRLNIGQDNLYSVFRLASLTEKESRLWGWIRLHSTLSKACTSGSFSKQDLDVYHDLKQKEIEHLNDARLRNLNNFAGDIAKIKVSFDSGKRFTLDQTRVLLENISALIAEPDTISGFFPMEEDMIDLLIIDEASQVSIANSISLILRAKQVVVFGDEYQYGAVSAINVSSRYSAGYFKEIIQAYTQDYQVTTSQEDMESLLNDVSREITDDDLVADRVLRPQDNSGAIEWMKTFNIRTSTLAFAKAIANYTTSLTEHYRSFPEIIDYSNEFFYRQAQLELMVSRIRTKPIGEVLKFIPVETRGHSGRNVNFDEIDAVIEDLKARLQNQYGGSIGIITSFREQQARMEQTLNEQMNMPELKRKHKLAIWFVGDVQGEERDLIYYSFVQDKKYDNADLSSIYPVLGGTADTIRSLKMQRLNVGFSRAKDTMVFVHSMPLEDYSNTRLGDALKHYQKLLYENLKNDFFVEDPNVFDSPAEKNLYHLLINTDFVKSNRAYIKIVPQFKIGAYISAQFAKQMPKYRVDFLMTLSREGREETLILEYDGVEFHTKNPDMVNAFNFSQQYLDYDVHRQIELESCGYRFLRLNKFNLRPEREGETSVDMLNRLLMHSFGQL